MVYFGLIMFPMSEQSLADLIQHLCRRIPELQRTNQGWSIELHGKGATVQMKETVTQQYQTGTQRLDELRTVRQTT
jgi:hypothetical protein